MARKRAPGSGPGELARPDSPNPGNKITADEGLLDKLSVPEISPDDETKLDERLESDVEVDDASLDEVAARDDERLGRLLSSID